MDWKAFLTHQRIPYVTTGPSATRDHVNIKCPFCADDPSEHLGISLKGYGWNCWRNPAHKGRQATVLIQALLRCSLEEARRYTQDEQALPPDRDLASEVRARLGETPVANGRVTALSMPDWFKSINNGSVFAKPYRSYLIERGYRGAQLDWLIRTYDLHYARKGIYSGRIIIPYYDRYRRLLTWTGRTIRAGETWRYRTMRAQEQVCSPKETLLGLPVLWAADNPRVLVVCEGPFDAMWVTSYGHSWGVYGTCLSGLSLSQQQIERLEELRQRFERIVLLLDSAAGLQAFRLAHSGFECETHQLSGAKDPAELPPQKMIELCVSLVR